MALGELQWRALIPVGGSFFEQGGTLVHIPSSMQFPQRSDRFERELRPTVYDRMGYNVSVGYNRTSRLFRAGSDRSYGVRLSWWRRAKTEVLKVHSAATLLAEAAVTLSDPDGDVPGRRASYHVPTEAREVISVVQLFRRGIWVLKYRVTYFRSQRSDPDLGVMAVVQALGCPRGT